MMAPTHEYRLMKFHQSLSLTNRLSLIAVTIAAVSALLAFGIRGLTLGAFLFLAGVAILFLAFVNPINYALSMWTIPPVFRWTCCHLVIPTTYPTLIIPHMSLLNQL